MRDGRGALQAKRVLAGCQEEGSLPLPARRGRLEASRRPGQAGAHHPATIDVDIYRARLVGGIQGMELKQPCFIHAEIVFGEVRILPLVEEHRLVIPTFRAIHAEVRTRELLGAHDHLRPFERLLPRHHLASIHPSCQRRRAAQRCCP